MIPPNTAAISGVEPSLATGAYGTLFVFNKLPYAPTSGRFSVHARDILEKRSKQGSSALFQKYRRIAAGFFPHLHPAHPARFPRRSIIAAPPYSAAPLIQLISFG